MLICRRNWRSGSAVGTKIIVKPLREIGLRDAEDNVLIEAAKRFGDIVIMTKDAEFVDLVRTLGAPPQMIWLRCGNLSNAELQFWLSSRFDLCLKQIGAGNLIVEVM